MRNVKRIELKTNPLLLLLSILALFIAGLSVYFIDSLWAGSIFNHPDFSFDTAPQLIPWIHLNILAFSIACMLIFRVTTEEVYLSSHFEAPRGRLFWCIGMGILFTIVVIFFPAFLVSEQIPAVQKEDIHPIPIRYLKQKLFLFNAVGYLGAAVALGGMLHSAWLTSNSTSLLDLRLAINSFNSHLNWVALLFTLGVGATALQLIGLRNLIEAHPGAISDKPYETMILPYGSIHTLALVMGYYPCMHFIKSQATKLINRLPVRSPNSLEELKLRDEKLEYLGIKGTYWDNLKISAPIAVSLINELGKMAIANGP